MREEEEKKVKVIYQLQNLQDNQYQVTNINQQDYYITTSLNF